MNCSSGPPRPLHFCNHVDLRSLGRAKSIQKQAEPQACLAGRRAKGLVSELDHESEFGTPSPPGLRDMGITQASGGGRGVPSVVPTFPAKSENKDLASAAAHGQGQGFPTHHSLPAFSPQPPPPTLPGNTLASPPPPHPPMSGT